MSIQAYAGEFTVSPIALEMSLNFCSHKCAYCFANLNDPKRELDVPATIRQIKNCHNSKSLTSYLLANKYPVLLSNRVDPFAHSNWRQSLTFIDMLYTNGNPIAYQTKGGQGIDEALELITDPAHFYISMSFWNDEQRKLIEPAAPSIKSRFELIEKLKAKGHHVSVGMNPLVEAWLPIGEAELLVDRLQDLGVEDYWISMLHLNDKQISRMSGKEKINMGVPVITEAKKRLRNDSYFRHIHNLLSSVGNVYSTGQPFASNYMQSYHDTYKGKTLKTNQDFVNYLFEKYPNGAEIKFGEYYDFMKADFYDQKFSEADGYAYRIARNLYHKQVTTKLKTLRDVLKFYWQNPSISRCVASSGLFSVLSYVDNGEDWEYLCKEDNSIIHYFHGYNANKWRHYVD